jgi:peptidoglycan hydrolase-like protein with peptidoglycan-binding domain
MAFRCGLIEVGLKLGIDPNYMAMVISGESGFDPSIRNQWCLKNLDPTGQRCAVGLIQFMPFVLKAWGYTPDQVAAMSDVEQLPLVERFFRPYASKCTSAGRTYMAAFLPAFAEKDVSYKLGVKGDQANKLPGTSLTLGDIYAQNPFDKSGKGYFTVGDVVDHGNGILEKARTRGTVEVSCSGVSAVVSPKAVAAVGSFSESSPPLALPTLELGSRGDAVGLWQRILGVNPDGEFGPVTRKATLVWQEARALKPDGVVGPKTWRTAP